MSRFLFGKTGVRSEESEVRSQESGDREDIEATTLLERLHYTMKKINSIIKFGEQVDGYAVPVLNEREIRAAAGIMFLGLFIALTQVLYKNNFFLVKYVVLVFLTDFVIRILINPRFSPTLIIGRLIVSNQVPEYVSASPKKFAWKIGLILSSLMFLLLVLLNSYSIITVVSCYLCLAFLFFEAAFGICLGCLFYRLFYKDKPLYCSGEICHPTERQTIQKTAPIQMIAIFGLVVFLAITIFLFNNYFHVPPKSLKEIFNSTTNISFTTDDSSIGSLWPVVHFGA